MNDQERPVLDGPQDFKIIGKKAAAVVNLDISCSWIDDRDSTDPGDRPSEPNEVIAIKLVGSSEAVDDPSDSGIGLRVPLVMGELEVFGNGAVLVFSFRGAQVHAHYDSVLKLKFQRLIFETCAHRFLRS